MRKHKQPYLSGERSAETTPSTIRHGSLRSTRLTEASKGAMVIDFHNPESSFGSRTGANNRKTGRERSRKQVKAAKVKPSQASLQYMAAPLFASTNPHQRTMIGGEEEVTSAYTFAQRKALSITPHVTGLISFLGSAFIVVEVLRDRNKRSQIYHRLILGVSITTLVSSIFFGLSTWPIPEGTAHVYRDDRTDRMSGGGNSTIGCLVC